MIPGRNRELLETREKDQMERGTQPGIGSFPPFAYLTCFVVKRNEPRHLGCYEGDEGSFSGAGVTPSATFGRASEGKRTGWLDCDERFRLRQLSAKA